ncbi:hypothetical protein EV1_034530 [Malus domestica]
MAFVTIECWPARVFLGIRGILGSGRVIPSLRSNSSPSQIFCSNLKNSRSGAVFKMCELCFQASPKRLQPYEFTDLLIFHSGPGSDFPGTGKIWKKIALQGVEGLLVGEGNNIKILQDATATLKSVWKILRDLKPKIRSGQDAKLGRLILSYGFGTDWDGSRWLSFDEGLVNESHAAFARRERGRE